MAVSGGRNGARGGVQASDGAGRAFVNRGIQDYFQNANYWAAFCLHSMAKSFKKSVVWLSRLSKSLEAISICVQTMSVVKRRRNQESSLSWRAESPL